MDLLLQAAKVLEQENSSGSPDRVSARSTRGSGSHQHGRIRGESQSEKDDHFGNRGTSLLEDNAGSADDEGLSGSERRRAGGAGTREVHNQLEKNRRKQMRECFNYLQQCIPSLENKRVATQSILQGAIKHIKGLKKKNVEQEREIQMLAKRKSELKRKHDVEFNKCTEDQQRLAEAMLKMRKPVVHQSAPDEDGHTSDSTTTASEGPGNEDDFSDDEKAEDRERGHLSRVNPVVAAKLDGFRKRKLASLDAHPKSTDYIIASMKDAGLLTAPSSKPRSSSLSSVSSSSVALKNMLEQKKKQQINHFSTGTSPPSSSMVDKVRPKSASANPNKVPLTTASKSGSSLMSSHPMISNQLAAMPSLPSVIPPLSSIHNKDVQASDNSGSVSAGSLLHIKGAAIPTPYSGVNDRIRIVGSDKTDIMSRQNSVIYAPSSLMSTVLDQATALQSGRVRLNSSSSKLSSDATVKPKNETHVSNMSISPSVVKVEAMKNSPFDFTSGTAGRISGSNPSTISVIQAPVSSPGSTAKVLPSVIPMSLIRGISLNSGLGLAPTLSSSVSSGLDSVISVAPVVSSSILSQKVGQPLASEILLTSPTKSETNNPSELATSMNHVTALLAPPMGTSMPAATVIKPPSSYMTTIPAATNLSSSVQPANISLQDTLKTMAIAPTLLPFTVTGVPLSSSTTQSVSPITPALRFYTPISPNSVVAATPLTNGQTASLMPAVVRLGVLQNFIPAHVQVQPQQMIAQPIVVVTTPSSIISPVDSTSSALAHPVNGTQPSVSSSSVL